MSFVPLLCPLFFLDMLAHWWEWKFVGAGVSFCEESDVGLFFRSVDTEARLCASQNGSALFRAELLVTQSVDRVSLF
jgi:hypothetical protein